MSNDVYRAFLKARMEEDGVPPDFVVNESARMLKECDRMLDWFSRVVMPAYMVQGTATATDIENASNLIGLLKQVRTNSATMHDLFREE